MIRSVYTRVLLDELLDDAKHGELDDLAVEVYDSLSWYDDYTPTDDVDEKRLCLVDAIRGLIREVQAEGEGA